MTKIVYVTFVELTDYLKDKYPSQEMGLSFSASKSVFIFKPKKDLIFSEKEITDFASEILEKKGEDKFDYLKYLSSQSDTTKLAFVISDEA